MSAEEPAAVIRRAFNALNAGDIAGWFACLDPAYVLRDLPPDQPRDRETLRDLVLLIRASFPDLAVTVDELLAVGGTVVTRETWRGTHLGARPGPGRGAGFSMVSTAPPSSSRATIAGNR